MSTEPDAWLSVTDYAQAYGVDRSTVYKFLSAGILETYKVKLDGILVVRIRNLPPDRHRPTTTSSEDVGRC